MKNTLDKVVSGGLCHGCGGCSSAIGNRKVEMRFCSEGYLRPFAKSPLSEADERILSEVCSGKAIEREQPVGASYDPMWGQLYSVETGYSTRADIRYSGSSGGVISAIVAYLLETGVVDFAVQNSSDPDDPVGNLTRRSTTTEEVLDASGSRYSPSSPLDGLEANLALGRPFVFVGKPCDVATLSRMARRDPRINELISVKLSFFCAGIPSRKGSIAVINDLGLNPKDVIRFSYRGNGWPGLTRAVSRDGSEKTMDYNSSWGKILNRYLQHRCKICPDGIGEFADIVCADAWYGKDGFPDFAERDGRSLIIARTKKGRQILDKLKIAGEIATEKLSPEEIEHMQPYQVNRKRGLLARLLAMRLSGFAVPSYNGFGLGLVAREAGLVFLARTFLGTCRRLKGKKNLS